jgi:hypothetical protein
MWLYRTHRIFLDFFHRPIFQKTQRFGNWICFRPQVKVGEKTPTQLGLLERANLNHWNTGRWKKSRKILWILYVHHCQNPFKSTRYMIVQNSLCACIHLRKIWIVNLSVLTYGHKYLACARMISSVWDKNSENFWEMRQEWEFSWPE